MAGRGFRSVLLDELLDAAAGAVRRATGDGAGPRVGRVEQVVRVADAAKFVGATASRRVSAVCLWSGHRTPSPSSPVNNIMIYQG